MSGRSFVFAFAAAAFAHMAAANEASRGSAMLQVSADGSIAVAKTPAPAPQVQLAKMDADTNESSKAWAYRKLIREVLKEPFVDGWEHYVDCVEACSEAGGDALVCAHDCYNELAPMYQELPKPEDILGTGPPPTPVPTPSTTPGPESCNGNPQCLWLKCCHAYTAHCLSCVVDAAPADLCMMSQYLKVPGCPQVLLDALLEERAKNKKDDAF